MRILIAQHSSILNVETFHKFTLKVIVNKDTPGYSGRPRRFPDKDQLRLSLLFSVGCCYYCKPLQWRHNWRDSVSNHQPHDCLLNGLFRRRSNKTWKLRVTGLCSGNSPGTGEFPAWMASKAENVSIWWRHHEPNLHRWLAGQPSKLGIDM